MNRRSFITNLIGASAAFSILPAATTYARKWYVPKQVGGIPCYEINQDWVNATYELIFWTPNETIIVNEVMPVPGRFYPKIVELVLNP